MFPPCLLFEGAVNYTIIYGQVRRFFLNKNTLAYFFGIFDDAEKSFQKYGFGLNCLFKKMDLLDTLTLDFSRKYIHFFG